MKLKKINPHQTPFRNQSDAEMYAMGWNECCEKHDYLKAEKKAKQPDALITHNDIQNLVTRIEKLEKIPIHHMQLDIQDRFNRLAKLEAEAIKNGDRVMMTGEKILTGLHTGEPKLTQTIRKING